MKIEIIDTHLVYIQKNYNISYFIWILRNHGDALPW